MLKETAKMLAGIGLPEGDAYDLPSSPLTFPDKANYRIEISGIENLAVLRALVDEMEKRDIPVHRIIGIVEENWQEARLSKMGAADLAIPKTTRKM